MSLIVASPWEPRGELNRFLRYYPRLQSIFDGGLVVGLASHTHPAEIDALEQLGIQYGFYEHYSGRHLVMRLALETDADYIQYCDMDRLIRWLELRPDELRETARRVQTTDMLIIGRTPEAYGTHSRTLIDTEAIPNRVFSDYFGQAMDFSAGSRGFSRRAAQLVMHFTASPENALWMDAGWAVLNKRAGYTWDYIEVDGLDWETADRHLEQAATREQQQALAHIQDQDAGLWQLRARIAQEMTHFGLLAAAMPIEDLMSQEKEA